MRRKAGEAGDGIISGFETRRRAVPVAPTAEERMKPGAERSTRYQRTGFTKARVKEAWSGEDQGSLRWKKLVWFEGEMGQ